MCPTKKSYVPMYHRITSNSHIVVASQISKMAKLKKKPLERKSKRLKAKANVGIHLRKKKIPEDPIQKSSRINGQKLTENQVGDGGAGNSDVVPGNNDDNRRTLSRQHIMKLPTTCQKKQT